MRRRSSAHRRDDNHHQIVAALKAAGWTVFDLSQAGGGIPDLLALKQGAVKLIEVKDGAKTASRRALSPAEQSVHAACQSAGVTVHIVESVDQAVQL